MKDRGVVTCIHVVGCALPSMYSTWEYSIYLVGRYSFIDLSSYPSIVRPVGRVLYKYGK